MDERKNTLLWGIILIIMGIIFLAGNFSRVGMEVLWPLFPLGVGIGFWIGYFKDRKNAGLVMPGSILVVVSLLFLYCSLFGWWRMETLWPFFIIAPGVGFFAMYFAGSKDENLIIPGGILMVVGLIFLFLSSGLGNYWPVFLIIAGIAYILTNGFKKESQKRGDG